MDASAVGRWSMMAQPGIVEMNHVRGVSNTQSPYFPTFSQHWSLIRPSLDPAMGTSGVGRWSVLSTLCTDSSAQHSCCSKKLNHLCIVPDLIYFKHLVKI